MMMGKTDIRQAKQPIAMDPELRHQGLRRQVQEFKRSFGWVGFIQVLFYPLILSVTTPIRFFQTMSNLLCLASEPWSRFARLSIQRSLNSSAHRAYDVLIEKYGRNGYAYNISLGRCLAPFFFFNKFSVRLYHHNEIVIPWLGALVMVLSQVVWLDGRLVTWVILATLLLGLFSTLFYFGAFEGLKHDSLAWALVPLGYYALLIGNFWWFALLFLAITFLSVSVTIVQGAVWFFVGLFVQGPWVLLAFVPTGLKILTHFEFVFRGKDLKSMYSTLVGIGLTGSGAKLRRLRLSTIGWYFLGLWGLYLIGLWRLAQPSPILVRSEQLVIAGLPVLLYMVNKGFRRFADEQTIYMLVFCAFSVVTLHQPHGALLPLLWLALSPLPLFLAFTDEIGSRELIWQVPLRRPYRIKPLQDICTAFMQPVGQRERILFHFDYDPEKYRSQDGLTHLQEYLNYLGSEREAVIIPDFYLFFDSYAGRFPLAELYQDASPQGRRKAMATVGACFLILPTQSRELPPAWAEAGFVMRTHLDLTQGYEVGLWNRTVYRDGCTHLLLLEVLDLDTSLTSCGAILEMAPNRLRLQLDEKGEAIIRLLYTSGWKGPTGIIVDAHPGSIPWIRVRGNANTSVELNFNYFEALNLA